MLLTAAVLLRSDTDTLNFGAKEHSFLVGVVLITSLFVDNKSTLQLPQTLSATGNTEEFKPPYPTLRFGPWRETGQASDKRVNRRTSWCPYQCNLHNVLMVLFNLLDRHNYRINKQWEVIALNQLTSHIEQVHNSTDPSRLR